MGLLIRGVPQPTLFRFLLLYLWLCSISCMKTILSTDGSYSHLVWTSKMQSEMSVTTENESTQSKFPCGFSFHVAFGFHVARPHSCFGGVPSRLSPETRLPWHILHNIYQHHRLGIQSIKVLLMSMALGNFPRPISCICWFSRLHIFDRSNLRVL